jgi:hypothetical protein
VPYQLPAILQVEHLSRGDLAYALEDEGVIGVVVGKRHGAKRMIGSQPRNQQHSVPAF